MATLEDYLFVKNTRWIWWGLGALVLALLIFHAGYALGTRRGLPSGPDRAVRVGGFGISKFMPPQTFIVGGHGAAGTIATVTLPTIILKQNDGDDETVLVTASSTIRPPEPLSAGQYVIILGTPEGSSTLQAKLIEIK